MNYKDIKFSKKDLRNIEEIALREMHQIPREICQDLDHPRQQQSFCYLKAVTLVLAKKGLTDFTGSYEGE